MHKVLAIPGDGIGDEILSATIQAVGALTDRVEFIMGDAGIEYFKDTGRTMSAEALEALPECEAVLVGAFAPPHTVKGYRNPEDDIVRSIDGMANVRRIKRVAPNIGHGDVDCYIVSNRPGSNMVTETEDMDGITRSTRMQYSQVHAACGVAATIAERTGRNRVSCVLGGRTSPLTDERYTEIFRKEMDGKGLELSETTMVQVMQWIADARTDFDIAVVSDLHAFLLAKGLSATVGGTYLMGVMTPGHNGALFRASHGHCPHLEGLNCANPTGLMMAAVMMLRHIGLPNEAVILNAAISSAYEQGYIPRDLGGTTGTYDFAAQVAHYFEDPI